MAALSRPGDVALPEEPTRGVALPQGILFPGYLIEKELGRGGMGTVYAATHLVLRHRVAIKVLNLDVSGDDSLVARFVQEAQACSRIAHPNIIKVFDFGVTDDHRPYFVMEFLEGESMAAWLENGRPDPPEALRLLLQVCDALEAAHQEHIIHRDLKPDNLWIARPKRGDSYIKVLDFGIAKLMEGDDDQAKTKTGMAMGTPYYMSPEQCRGRGVDHRTDIYAMGAIFYLVFSGRLPFVKESTAELIAAHLNESPPKPSEFANVPLGLETLILACLDKKPENRPASAATLGTLLKEACSCNGSTTVAIPCTQENDIPVHSASLWRKRRAWYLVAAGMAVVGTSMAAWLALRGRQTPLAQSKPSVTALAASSTSALRPASPPPSVAPQATPPTPTQPDEGQGLTPRFKSSRAVAKPFSPRERPATPAAKSVPTTPASPASEPQTKPSRSTREGLAEDL